MRALPSIVLSLVISTSTAFAFADENAEPGGVMSVSRRAPLFYPDGPGTFRWRAAVGFQVDVLPRRVVEDEVREFPKLSGNFRVGLPWGFSTDVRANGNVIANELSLGIAWSHRIGDFSFSVLDHQGVWGGYVGTDGFDATGWGFVNMPGLSIGVPWGSVRFSLLAEAIFTSGQHTTLGDASRTSRPGTTLAGSSFTLTVENLLDSGGIIYYGVGFLRTDADYQVWLAFSDDNAKLPYPRFVGGYAF